MGSFIEIEDADELISAALQLSDLEERCFFSMKDEEWTVQELVEETGRSRSMVQRAITALHDKGLVHREGKTDRTIYYVYRRVPLDEVQEQVGGVLDEWHQRMQDVLNT